MKIILRTHKEKLNFGNYYNFYSIETRQSFFFRKQNQFIEIRIVSSKRTNEKLELELFLFVIIFFHVFPYLVINTRLTVIDRVATLLE